MRRLPSVLAIAAAPLLATAAVPRAPAATPADLRAAKTAAAAAERRARLLDTRAERASDPAARARWQKEAVAARVASAEAEITAAEVRRALVERLLRAQRQRLAADQAPVARLLATLTGLARRPALLSVVQPGSLDDMVHARAVLDHVLPAVRSRTAALRDEVARARALRASALVASRSLDAGRARLLDAREALGVLSRGDGVDDRALSLGEEAREIVDQLQLVGDQQEVLADLVALPGPPAPAPVARAVAAPYRLPVVAPLLTGFGEVARDGVRARGLSLAPAAGALVAAPAAGSVVFARPFRSFGGIVIIDHGAGWTTLVTGLSAFAVARGDKVRAGSALGRASGGERPVMVELRRQGRPVDLAQLVGPG